VINLISFMKEINNKENYFLLISREGAKRGGGGTERDKNAMLSK
jgi:hypothetical protein